MTQTEFIARYRDELAGMLLDAAIEHRSGREAAIWLRVRLSKLNVLLAQMHGDLSKAPVSNGTPQQARK